MKIAILFKGQILKLIDGKGLSAKPGATAEVTRDYYPGDTYVEVKWIRSNLLSAGQMNGGYRLKAFKILEEEVNTKSFLDIN